MSLNAQRRNRLLHSIWVNRAPCKGPEDNGPPWICHYPLATCYHHLLTFSITKKQILFSNWTMPLTDRVTGFPA